MADNNHKPGSVIEKRKDGAVVVAMPFPPGKGTEQDFSRADLIFKGVGHRDASYEVRVFLNNPKANAETKRGSENGYAGKFIVFGHGGCAGDAGHCEVHDAPTGITAAAIAVARPHPLAPMTQVITITERLREILRDSKNGLQTLTLVPIKAMPKREDCRPAAGLLSYESVSLQTYR